MQPTVEPPDLVLGVDGGGTSTRCVVADLDGRVLGRGRAGGANPRSTQEPVANLVAALQQALDGIAPARVAAGVFGLAGAGAAGRERAEALATQAWRAAGLSGAPAVMPDLAVAFAAGTEQPDGILLLSGTGAAAALVRDGAVVRRCDGYGWLVGDDGSGLWVGREAVRATLAALDGRAGHTTLTRAVPQALLDDGAAGVSPAVLDGEAVGLDSEPLAQAIVASVHSGPPARLAILAPLVDDAARNGDPVAMAILDKAARLLLRSVAALDADGLHAPLVLAGSLLVQPTYLADRVRAGLGDRDPAQIVCAQDGAAGAAALALRLVAQPRHDDGAARSRARTAHRALLGCPMVAPS